MHMYFHNNSIIILILSILKMIFGKDKNPKQMKIARPKFYRWAMLLYVESAQLISNWRIR